jgi:hypothetical protein
VLADGVCVCVYLEEEVAALASETAALGSGTAWRAPSSETAALGLGLGDSVAGAHSSETGTGTTAHYQPGSAVSAPGESWGSCWNHRGFYIVNTSQADFWKNRL